jgi:hypothetical protein
MEVHDIRDDRAAADQLRREIEMERDELVDAVGSLRRTARTARLTRPLQRRLPVLLGGMFLVGFLVSGGVGAAARLAFRRGREGRSVLRVGRFTVVER